MLIGWKFYLEGGAVNCADLVNADLCEQYGSGELPATWLIPPNFKSPSVRLPDNPAKDIAMHLSDWLQTLHEDPLYHDQLVDMIPNMTPIEYARLGSCCCCRSTTLFFFPAFETWTNCGTTFRSGWEKRLTLASSLNGAITVTFLSMNLCWTNST